MTNYIWVFIEHQHGEIHESSLEILGEAQKQAGSIQGKVCAFVFGEKTLSFCEQLIAYGADLIILCEDLRLGNYDVELYTEAFTSMVQDYPPQMVMISATANGISLAPKLAVRLKYGYSANTVTTALQSDGRVRISRAVCMGKAHCIVDYPPGKGIVITMQPGSIGLDKANHTRKGDMVSMHLSESLRPRTEVKGLVKADPKSVALDEAEYVVAAGSGFKTKADLNLIWNLGEALGAAVGGSKPIIDQGWLPRQRMIGQSSGRRITPRLFIGAGISGTSYFIEGMKDSRLTIAINRDKGAFLMKTADLAVVGDLYSVLPELTKQLKERQRKEV